MIDTTNAQDRRMAAPIGKHHADAENLAERLKRTYQNPFNYKLRQGRVNQYLSNPTAMKFIFEKFMLDVTLNSESENDSDSSESDSLSVLPFGM